LQIYVLDGREWTRRGTNAPSNAAGRAGYRVILPWKVKMSKLNIVRDTGLVRNSEVFELS